MRIIRTASGKQVIKLSKREWIAIGKKAGWTNSLETKTADSFSTLKIAPTCVQTLITTWFPRILSDVQKQAESGHKLEETGIPVSGNKDMINAYKAAHDFAHYVEIVEPYASFVASNNVYAKQTALQALKEIEKLQMSFQSKGIPIPSLQQASGIIEKVKQFSKQN
jgi:hypothetical protein